MRKAPIILIPGIQGTTLSNINNKDFTKVFSGIKKNFVNIHNIELQDDGLSDVGRENIVERSDVEDLAYSEIINYFRSRGFSVYIFGYDWRRSNMDSAEQLDLFVKSLTRKLSRSKFNFISHSMGGIVLSAYFKLLGQDTAIAKVVNRVIFTVPPFLGSMEAAVTMIVGKSMLINSSDDVRKVVRTFPALYEMFPVYDKAFTRGGTGIRIDYTDYDSFWQHNKIDLNSSISLIRRKAEKKKRLISTRFKDMASVRDAGNNLVFDLASMSQSLRDKIIILAGTGVDQTISQIEIKPHGPNPSIVNFFDFENGKHGDGDGTVAINSASIFKSSVTTLAIRSKSWETRYNSYFLLNDWHTFFLNNGRVQNVMKRFLEWHDSSITGDWYKSSASGVTRIV